MLGLRWRVGSTAGVGVTQPATNGQSSASWSPTLTGRATEGHHACERIRRGLAGGRAGAGRTHGQPTVTGVFVFSLPAPPTERCGASSFRKPSHAPIGTFS